MQAAGGQLDVLSRSQPIASVVADPATAPVTRERLELVREARAFAVRDLELPDGRSFRRYADLGRPFAIWSVVATPEFSVEPRRCCFPIAGCVAYRGYFDPDSARAEGLALAMRGDDVSVGGVATYSTLGHLPDPVFNTMLGWREARLIGTIFHELAHEQLYVADDTEFNEAYASVVAAAGIRRWYAIARSRSRARRMGTTGGARARVRGPAARGARASRAALFERRAARGAARRARNASSAGSSSTTRGCASSGADTRGYDAWFDRALNNAHLAAVGTYEDCVPGLTRELEAAGSLPAFYRRAAALAALPRTQRHADVCNARAERPLNAERPPNAGSTPAST